MRRGLDEPQARAGNLPVALGDDGPALEAVAEQVPLPQIRAFEEAGSVASVETRVRGYSLVGESLSA